MKTNRLQELISEQTAVMATKGISAGRDGLCRMQALREIVVKAD